MSASAWRDHPQCRERAVQASQLDQVGVCPQAEECHWVPVSQEWRHDQWHMPVRLQASHLEWAVLHLVCHPASQVVFPLECPQSGK